MNIPIPVAVAVGGCVGALLRHSISSSITTAVGPGHAHWGTLTVNLIGCLLIGLLMGFGERASWLTPALQKCLVTGLLGALTTFSTFAFDTLRLLNDGRWTAAVASVSSNLLLGILLVWLGMKAANAMLPPLPETVDESSHVQM